MSRTHNGKLRHIISQDKLLELLEWILFILFIIIAGWFSSGVIQHFFSKKTSFSQYEVEIKKYPVISIIFVGYKASEVNLTNVKIFYHTKGMKGYHELQTGENHLHNERCNKTEIIIFEIFEDFKGRRVFRIIHTTPILHKTPEVEIKTYTKLKMKNGAFSDLVIFYLTSQENSPGIFDLTWKDGKPVRIIMDKNTFLQYSLQPLMTKYLEEMGKCQKEPYYQCIASQLDTIEYGFSHCSNKCIPDAFSIVSKNYSTPFCQNDTANQQCNFKNKQEIASKSCKKSCSILKYFGEFELNFPYQSEKENWNIYFITYLLSNEDFTLTMFEQYMIYDAIGMIQSVGGTEGMFIKFLDRQLTIYFGFHDLLSFFIFFYSFKECLLDSL